MPYEAVVSAEWDCPGWPGPTQYRVQELTAPESGDARNEINHMPKGGCR